MKPKIVLFNLPGASGHINPTVGLVSELINNGCHLIYYAGEDSRQKMEALGAEFRTYDKWFVYQHNPDTGSDLIAMALEELAMTELCIDDLLVQLKAENIDLIIYDACCPWGKYLSEALRIPGINIITTIVSSPWLIISDWTLGVFIIELLVRNGLTVVPQKLKQLKNILQRIDAPYRNVVYHVFDFFANVGQLNLVFNTELFQPFSERLNGNFKYVGASILPHRDEIALEFRFIESLDNKALVYVSLGTLHNRRPEFYQLCIDAFSDMSIEVVISIGNHINVKDFKNVPKHIHLYNHVPQLYILKYAHLFITHGGMNSLNEGLAHGVPLIVCPQQFEQDFNGRRFAKMGLAKNFGLNEAISVKALQKYAEEVLGNAEYRRKVAGYQLELESCGGYKRAAEEVMKFYREKIDAPSLSLKAG